MELQLSVRTLETVTCSQERRLAEHCAPTPAVLAIACTSQRQMEVQNMIRRNAEEAQTYTQDLLKWQAEQSAADLRRRQAAATPDRSSAAQQAPVR